MKRVAIFAIMMSLILATVSASAFEVDWALGARRSSIEDEIMFFNQKVSYRGASLRFQTDMGDIFDLALTYDLEQGKTLLHTFDSAMQIVPHEGGFNTLSYIFSQDIAFGWFHIRYEAGIKGGMAWSPYTSIVQWALSPMAGLELGVRTDMFHLDMFATSFLPEEPAWRATVSLGFETGIEVDRQLAFYIRGYAELAEVLMNPYTTIAGYGVSAGVLLRGLE